MNRVATTTLLVLLIVGCSNPPMRGIVAKKQHRNSWTQFVPISTGKTIIVYPIIHPEQWDIVVQADGTDGEEGRFLVVVSREDWESVNIGDVWQRSDTVEENQ